VAGAGGLHRGVRPRHSQKAACGTQVQARRRHTCKPRSVWRPNGEHLLVETIILDGVSASLH
jgi:hypothetical protein